MKKTILYICLLLSACSEIGTENNFIRHINYGNSISHPIYLSFGHNQKPHFYFILSKNNHTDNYRIKVRWHNICKKELLFNLEETTLKFLVNNKEVYGFKPVQIPKVRAYDINEEIQIEGAIFSIPEEIFKKFTTANIVFVELHGKNKVILGKFTKRHTKVAFKNFYNNSL